MSGKRKYTKKDDDYWRNLSKSSAEFERQEESEARKVFLKSQGNWAPESFSFGGSSVYSPNASSSSSSFSRRNRVTTQPIKDAYKNLYDFSLPYYRYKSDKITIYETVDIIEKTYANVSAFKNTIDIMTEFSASEFYLTGGSKKSKAFVTKWLERAKIAKFTEDFFREYYRSGNVFIYTYFGKFNTSEFENINKIYAAKKQNIPLRFTILDAKDITIHSSSSPDFPSWEKVMSRFEAERLKQQRTSDDKEILKNLPEDIRNKILNHNFHNEGINIPIDPSRLFTVFYKKQPYEPFAIPFGYPVLRDLNHKEELKKIDLAVVRSMNQLILLVTMGDAKDGVDPEKLGVMQDLFRNESVARTLVSDYTTEAKFITPQVADLLGPNKYQVVNQDIQDGLLNIMVGSENFSNQGQKIKMFFKRLSKGRDVYLDEFLNPQIKMICKAMGFRDYPKANFVDIDLQDQTEIGRMVSRLVEIGILTPEQGFTAMKKGVFPEQEDVIEAQTEYIELRKKGMFNPLVGGIPMIPSAEGEANRKFQKEHKIQLKDVPTEDVSIQKGGGGPNPNSPNNGRPKGASARKGYGVKAIRNTIDDMFNIRTKCESLLKEKFSTEELNEVQKDCSFKIVEVITSHYKKEDWLNEMQNLIANIETLTSIKPNEVSGSIDAISVEHKLGTYEASILYHSQCQAIE